MIEKFLLSVSIIAFGLLAGRAIRIYCEKGKLPPLSRMQLLLRRVTFTAICGLGPVVLVGAFWAVSLEDVKLIYLPLLGVLSLVLGGLLAVGASKLHRLDRPKTGAMFVSGSFSNMGSFGTLFCFMFLGEQSLAFVAMFRLFEEFVYYSVGFPIARSFGAAVAGEGASGRRTPAALLKDPLFMASFTAILIGGLLNLSSWERPVAYESAMSIFVPLSTFLLVVPVGFSMKPQAIKGFVKETLSISAVKFVLVPVCTVSLAYLLGLGSLHDGMIIKVILILSAMPPAFASLVPPQLYKLDADLANSSWLVNTAMLTVVLPVLYFAVDAM
jgi:predicted permease